jgi:serine protease inhibitor
LSLYRKMRNEPGNILISPYGISSALSMACTGASGKTADEIAVVMGWGLGLSNGYRALRQRLQALDEAGPYTIRTASRLWCSPIVRFKEQFLATTRNNYGADAMTLDFQAGDVARQKINAWVDEQTHGAIKTVLNFPLPPETSMVLCNAMYFHGSWEMKFARSDTRPDEPFGMDEKWFRVPFMWLIEDCLYAEVDGLQILDKPYRGKELSMTILLPSHNVGALEDLERLLTLENLHRWLGRLKSQSVEIMLPKFKFDRDRDLRSPLADLGMRRMFSPTEADFSGIGDAPKPIYLQYVFHKAIIDVNEEGTKAAAATNAFAGRMGGLRPSERVLFRADHPFVFLIRDRRTGDILFLGRLASLDGPEFKGEMPQPPPPPTRRGGGMF